MNVFVLTVLVLAGSFDLVKVPMEPDESVALVLASPDHANRLAVLTNRLHLHAAGDVDSSSRQEVPMLSGVYDIEAQDASDSVNVIAIEGRAVKRYRFAAVGAPAKSSVLFELDTPYPASGGNGFRVLLVSLNGQTLLAVPRSTGLTLFDLSGALVRTVPPPSDAEASSSVRSHFERSEQKGRWGVTIEPAHSFGWLLPEPVKPAGLESMAAKSTRISHRYAGGEAALQVHAEDNVRTLAVVAPDDGREARTVLRYRKLKSEEASDSVDEADPSTAISFPGYLYVADGALPDFNGDGYGDLPLWTFTQPVASPDALLRTLSSDTWPVRCSIHLFEPERNRHAPKPAAKLDIRSRLGNMLPHEAFINRDLDADGYCDLAVCPSSNSFNIWLWKGKAGFDAKPDFVAQLPEGIEDIEGALPRRDGATAVALRTASALYVVVNRP